MAKVMSSIGAHNEVAHSTALLKEARLDDLAE